MAQQFIQSELEKIPPETTVAFTDGSCLKNPGPCGAGAVLYLPTQREEIRIIHPVAPRGSILLAELVAIQQVVQYILQGIATMSVRLSELCILSDCQSAIGILSLNWESKSHRQVIKDITNGIWELERQDIPLKFIWAPGHADITGNEIADTLAKGAAEIARNLPQGKNNTTTQDIIRASKFRSTYKWQRRWDLSDRGRQLYHICSKINHQTVFDQPARSWYVILAQLRPGYSSLNAYKANFDQNISPTCTCGSYETTEHVLIHCPNYEEAREKMRVKVFNATGLSGIDLSLLLGRDSEDLSLQTRTKITKYLCDFLHSTGLFRTADPASEESP